MSGCVQSLFVYTLECYPTGIRALGLGSCSAISRLGGLTTPFIAQVLFISWPHTALGVYVCLSFLAVLVSLLLPLETNGRSLLVSITAKLKKLKMKYMFFFI